MGKKIKIISKETGKIRYVDKENLAFFTKENFAKEGLYGREEQYKYFCEHPEEIEDQKLFSELGKEFNKKEY